MKKVISLILALGLTFGIAGPAMGESRLITAAGITQGTADSLYGSLAGEAGWGGTQDHSLAILIAKAATTDGHVVNRLFGDGRYAQLAAASNTFTGVQLLPDGTSSDPPLAFASESGTGLFLTKAGRIALTVDGTGTILTLDISTLTVDVSTKLGNANTDDLFISSEEVAWTSTNDVHHIYTSSALYTGAPIMRFETSFQVLGDLDIEGTDGLILTPGASDADLVSVTGGGKLQWKNATSSFNFTNALRVVSIGIGVMPLTPTAALQISSTTQGSIPSPPMTSAQRDAIGSPPESLRVYDLTNNVPNYFNGTGWRAVLNIAASTLTVGEIPFAISASGVDCDPNLFWDNTDKQLGIGTNTPDNSAALDVASTTAGSLPVPRMTTAQRNAIGTPADGLQVDDSDLNALTRYNGSGYDVVSVNIPTIKSGAKTSGSFTGNPRTATVTFGTAFPDANYSVTAIGVDGRGWTIDSQVAGSFVINSNASSALTGSVSWTAIAHNDP